jgi:KipI family sensor histidine kinase inhibitor
MPLGPGLLRFHEYGDAGVLVDVLDEDYPVRWFTTQALGESLRGNPPPGLVEVVASYQNVFVSFDPLITDHATLRTAIQALMSARHRHTPSRRFVVPVVYGGEFGPDLESVATLLGLSAQEVVGRHSGQDWVVRFVGSPVGAPMLDGPRMPGSIPRLQEPRARVEAGSVAVSGFQSMVYNAPSPGGWQLIGRTPMILFDLARPPHVPYRAGDTVRFTRIGPQEWDRWRQPLAAGADVEHPDLA